MTGSVTILAGAPSTTTFRSSVGAAIADAGQTDQAQRDDQAVTTLKSVAAMRKQAGDATRTRVKQTLQRLKDELKLMKQMWAGDPKELARQISRLAKELKSALADYAQAAKDNGDSAGGANAGIEIASTPVPAATPDDSDQTAAKDQAPAEDKPAQAPADPDTAKAVAAYGRAANDDQAASRADAEMEAKGDLEFARDVHGFIQKLRDALQESKIRHAFNTIDRKGQVKAEEEAAKGLSDVDKMDTQMEVDVRADFPELSVAQAPPAAG